MKRASFPARLERAATLLRIGASYLEELAALLERYDAEIAHVVRRPSAEVGRTGPVLS